MAESTAADLAMQCNFIAKKPFGIRAAEIRTHNLLTHESPPKTTGLMRSYSA